MEYTQLHIDGMKAQIEYRHRWNIGIVGIQAIDGMQSGLDTR